MNEYKELFIELASRQLIIDSDNLSEVLRANRKFIDKFVAKFSNRGFSTYELLTEILFARGVKNTKGEKYSVESLTNTLSRIKKECV